MTLVYFLLGAVNLAVVVIAACAAVLAVVLIIQATHRVITRRKRKVDK